MISFLTIWAVQRGFDEVVELDAQGKPQLKPEREAKLAEDLRKMHNCQQYSLRAAKSKYYPCYSCVDTAWVFLNIGEVWKYGEKCSESDSRYTQDKLDAQYLTLVPEFWGNKIECYEEQQQRKIYRYPLLPENLKRINKLGHPPGNKQDN